MFPCGNSHKSSQKAKFQDVEASFKTSLDTHVLFGTWSAEQWGDHIRSLEEIVDNLARTNIWGRPAGAKPGLESTRLPPRYQFDVSFPIDKVFLL